MKLEQLRPNICELPGQEAYELFLAYYNKRQEDLDSVVVTPKKLASSTKKRIKKKKDEVSVSPHELELLKKVGLI